MAFGVLAILVHWISKCPCLVPTYALPHCSCAKKPWHDETLHVAGEGHQPEKHQRRQQNVSTPVLPVPSSMTQTVYIHMLLNTWFLGLGFDSPTVRLELCHKLGIHWIVEQPTSSLAFYYKPFWRLIKRHGAKRAHCSLGAFNANTLKPVSCQQKCLVELSGCSPHSFGLPTANVSS